MPGQPVAWDLVQWAGSVLKLRHLQGTLGQLCSQNTWDGRACVPGVGNDEIDQGCCPQASVDASNPRAQACIPGEKSCSWAGELGGGGWTGGDQCALGSRD